MRRFFDTHCHLQDERFSLDLEGVLARARSEGLTHLACCGTREEDWNSVLSLSQSHRDVIPLLGLHPWYVNDARPNWLLRLKDLLIQERAGLGECGLDFAIEGADRACQEQAFRDQLDLAKALDRPVSIHCRGAWESLAAIAKEVGLPQCGAVIHSFSGSAEVARQLQGLGFHISFSCSLANPENRRAAKALRAVERDHLLFETDAPDIAPRGIEINEPAQINLVLKAAAGILGVEEETLAAQVHENSRRIFGSLLQDANPSMRDCTQS